MDVDQAPAEQPAPAPAPVPEKPKFINVHLGVEAVWVRGALSPDEIMLQREIEVSLVEADRELKARQDARNQLEEYVYEWRDKVNDTKEHVHFRKNLEDTKNWLYDTEELLSKSIYLERLQVLDSECKVLFPPPPPPPPPAEPEPAPAPQADAPTGDQGPPEQVGSEAPVDTGNEKPLE